MPSKRESTFRNELRKSYEFVNFLPFVIYDHAFGAGTSFQRKRPFDMFVVDPRGTSFLELKVTTTKRFDLNRIAEHQLHYLSSINQLQQDRAFVVVNFRNAKEKLNRAFMIPVFTIQKMLEAGAKSVTISDLETRLSVQELPRKRYDSFYGWEIPMC